MRTEYRGYTIEANPDHQMSFEKFISYPTEEGISHDADWDGDSWRYCGNRTHASSIEYAKLEIDSKLDI
jgi:hypothetical protein